MKLATSHLTGRQAVTLLLDYAEDAPTAEVPGLVAALRCVLSSDELPAEAVVASVRAGRERRIREHAYLTECRKVLLDAYAVCQDLPDDVDTSWASQVHELRCFLSDVTEVLDALPCPPEYAGDDGDDDDGHVY